MKYSRNIQKIFLISTKREGYPRQRRETDRNPKILARPKIKKDAGAGFTIVYRDSDASVNLMNSSDADGVTEGRKQSLAARRRCRRAAGSQSLFDFTPVRHCKIHRCFPLGIEFNPAFRLTREVASRTARCKLTKMYGDANCTRSDGLCNYAFTEKQRDGI